MKTGAADWFHKDLYEDECKVETNLIDVPTGLEEHPAPQLPAFAAETATKAE